MKNLKTYLAFIFCIILVAKCAWANRAESSDTPDRPPIGVMGDAAAEFLKAQGFDCVPLPEDAWLQPAILTNYPVIVCDTLSHTSNPSYYETIRMYVNSGGVVYLSYCLQPDLGGTYFADSTAWGPCLSYTIEADSITGNLTAVGLQTALSNAWSDRKYESYGLREPDNISRSQVLIRGDFANRSLVTEEGAPRQIVSNLPWLVQTQFGAGMVLNGMNGAFGYAVRNHDISLTETLSNVVRHATGLGRQELEYLGAEYQPRIWPDLEQHSLRRAGDVRTGAFVPSQLFFQMDADWLAQRLRLFDSDRLDVIVSVQNLGRLDENAHEKIQALRRQGIIFSLSFSPRGLPLAERVSGSPARAAFFKTVADWAPRVDVIGMDEWYFTPSPGLLTQGAQKQDASDVESYRQRFQVATGLSDADVAWAFKNSSADDPRARSLWEFSNQLADDFMTEFLRTAKEANPKVRTWISYITHNWNKLVTCLEQSLEGFDELLNCQTYWYGGSSDDPLDAAGLLTPIGMGKVMRHEYPRHYFWTGFSPHYTGGRMARAKNYKWWKPSAASQYAMHYQNSPAEAVPYLALLYAVSDGVFIFTIGNSNPSEDGRDLDFADVVRLVSHLVPRIRDYRPSAVGYYYNPQESWEVTRQQLQGYDHCFYGRQMHLKTLGYLQMFCDLEVTSDPHRHRKLAVCGPVWAPERKADEQQLYLWSDRPWRYPDAQPLSESDWNVLGVMPARPLETTLSGIFGEKSAELGQRFHLQSDHLDEGGCSVTLPAKDAFVLQADGAARATRSLKITEDSVVTARTPAGDLINTLDPSLLTHTLARRLIGNDLRDLNWKVRDCPQVSGSSNLVAAAFREPREAVIDFGSENKFAQVKILVFNGETGIERAETLPYQAGMKVALSPYAVLVAQGILEH